MAPKFCRFHKRGLLSLPLVEHTKLRSYLCSKLHFAVNSLAWRPGTVLHAQGFVIQVPGMKNQNTGVNILYGELSARI